MRQENLQSAIRGLPRFYRPELDILRFFAFLLVFLHHLVKTTGTVAYAVRFACASGVCLFFQLSAYLITELLDREWNDTGTIDLSAFYIRRILRIWPLYIVFLLFGYILDHFANHHELSFGRLMAFLLLMGNWYAIKYGFAHSITSPLWSISIEEQFYVFWPSLRRYLHRSFALLAAYATLPIAYTCIFWLCRNQATPQTAIWANTFVQAQFFGVGAILAFTMRGRVPQLHGSLRFVAFGLGLFGLFIGQYLFQINNTNTNGTAYDTAFVYIGYLVGCTLLFFSILGFDRLRKWRFFIYLGKISYGLYVFHMLADVIYSRIFGHAVHRLRFSENMEQAIRLLFTLGICILLAHLSYRYLERPFLRLKERFTVIWTRAV